MTEPRAEAVVRRYFDRWDLIVLLSLTVVAFVLRFFSPIMPDFFLHPFQGPLVSNCVSHTPVDAKGDPGTPRQVSHARAREIAAALPALSL